MTKLYGKLRCGCGQIYELHLEPTNTPINKDDFPSGTERPAHSNETKNDFVLHAIERLHQRIEALEINRHNSISYDASAANDAIAAVNKIKCAIRDLNDMTYSLIPQDPKCMVSTVNRVLTEMLHLLEPLVAKSFVLDKSNEL